MSVPSVVTAVTPTLGVVTSLVPITASVTRVLMEMDSLVSVGKPWLQVCPLPASEFH